MHKVNISCFSCPRASWFLEAQLSGVFSSHTHTPETCTTHPPSCSRASPAGKRSRYYPDHRLKRRSLQEECLTQSRTGPSPEIITLSSSRAGVAVLMPAISSPLGNTQPLTANGRAAMVLWEVHAGWEHPHLPHIYLSSLVLL